MLKKTLALILVSVLVSVTGFTQTITDSLIVHYPLNGDANDHSGNGFDATLYGPTAVADRHGNPNHAFYFDGVNDYIQLPNNIELKPDMPASVSFWVKIESLAFLQNKFFRNDFDYNNYGGFWVISSSDGLGKVEAGFGGQLGSSNSSNRITYMSNTSLTVGNWFHIVVIFNGATNIDIFINGENSGGTYSGTGSTTVEYSSNAGKIGSAPANSITPITYNWGSIDDFAFWNRALNPSEVNQLYSGDPLGTVGLESIEEQITVNAFPNPFSDQITIKLENVEKENLSLYVYNSLGKRVGSENIVSDKVIFKRDNLPTGIYFYLIKDENNIVIGRGKMVIQ